MTATFLHFLSLYIVIGQTSTIEAFAESLKTLKRKTSAILTLEIGVARLLDNEVTNAFTFGFFITPISKYRHENRATAFQNVSLDRYLGLSN